jgi:hypothetical protein
MTSKEVKCLETILKSVEKLRDGDIDPDVSEMLINVVIISLRTLLYPSWRKH